MMENAGKMGIEMRFTGMELEESIRRPIAPLGQRKASMAEFQHEGTGFSDGGI